MAKKDKRAKAAGDEDAPAKPKKVRRKGPGLLDRLTVLVVGLFLVSAALPYVLA